MPITKIPTKKEFQALADTIKKEQNISRCQANEVLAKRYGFSSYGAIQKKLIIEKKQKPIQVSKDDFNSLLKNQMFNAAATSDSKYFRNYHKFERQKTIDGIVYNPVLPENFWSNSNRCKEELANWWNIAFICSYKFDKEPLFFKVYRLDGGAWDRPTTKGSFDNFNDALLKAQELNNIKPFKGKRYITLSNYSIVNSSGLFISSDGIKTTANVTNNEINLNHVANAKLFINTILEKRERFNIVQGTSYLLSSYAESFIKHYFPKKDSYISNGAFILALDQLGFKIKERKDFQDISLNIYTNSKTIKNFEKRLRIGEYDNNIK